MTNSEIIQDHILEYCPYCGCPVRLKWDNIEETISISCCVTMTSELSDQKNLEVFNLEVFKLARKWNNRPTETDLRRHIRKNQRDMKIMQHKIDKHDGQLDRYAKRVSELEENNVRK